MRFVLVPVTKRDGTLEHCVDYVFVYSPWKARPTHYSDNIMFAIRICVDCRTFYVYYTNTSSFYIL